MEAEVDDDEDEIEDEEEQAEIGNFIDQSHPDDLLDVGDADDERYHRELDRRKQMEDDVGAEDLAEQYKIKYGRKNAYSGRGALTDSAVVPKRLLLPSVHDPSIWGVKCKEGKESEVVMAIMKKYEESIGTDHELAITSAFERGGPNSVMKGYIYVEGHSSIDVQKALTDVMNVYPHTKMFLIEIKDMPDLLRVQPPPKLTPGTWVRIKRPKLYEGDLAQVLDITDTGLDAALKIIPRVDYSNREDRLAAEKASGLDKDGKRKRPGFFAKPRPPQRLFSEVEARKRNPAGLTMSTMANTFTFKNEEYSKGFLHKHIKIQHLITTNVNPTLEEVTKFASSDEKDGAENLDLKALAVSLKDSSANVAYLPGDIVEVFKGEQKGVIGKATNVVGDIVTITATEGDLNGQTIDVPTSSLRKRFKLGDHVKVTSLSRYEGEVGMVVKISDDRVTFLTDQNNTEITVFSKDLREASDISGQGSLGQYALLDLVQLDVTTVGCIVKVDRESLVVLDQNGSTRQVMPSQIANKIPKRKHTIAADRNGSEIRLDDVVKEYGGQQRQGKIIHIHRSFVFLHNNDSSENAGVYVTRSSSLMTVAAKGGRIAGGPDLSQMNPAAKRDPSGNSGMAAPPKQSFGRDRSIGQTVTIKKGGWKGLLGIVKDTTDTHARVELHTKGKIVTVPKVDLVFKDKVTGRTIDINGRGGGFGGRGGYGGPRGGGVDLGFGSRTPQVSSGSERTPAWGASSRGNPTRHDLNFSPLLLTLTRSHGTHPSVEPRPSCWLTHAGMGRRLSHGEPLRWKPHSLRIRLTYAGVVIRRKDASTRWLLPRLQDTSLRQRWWRFRVGRGIQDSSIWHLGADARRQQRCLGAYAIRIRRSYSWWSGCPHSRRRTQRSHPWCIQCAYAGCAECTHPCGLDRRLGRRLCTDPCGRSTDAWRKRRVLQCAYSCGLRQRGDPGGERAPVHRR